MKFSTYRPDDIEEIKQLFIKTFSDSEGQAEGLLIGDLAYDLMMSTDANDLYGFVVIEKQQIIGSIFFSKLTFESEANVFLLSPVAIQTNYQDKGIGQKLIIFGLNTIKEAGVELAITYGDPDFYSKVGFCRITEKTIKAPFRLSYLEGWLGRSLVNDEIEPIAGVSYCVHALNKSEYW